MADSAPAVVDHSIQTAYSDPEIWAGRLDEIEPAIAPVSARNVIAHYRAFADELPDETRDDISLRWIEAIVDTDQRRHRCALSIDRPLKDRVQGCCRDHTLLSVAALRHHGIPARSRVGFASYLASTAWNHDHVIVEAWLNGRWRRFDPELDAPRGTLSDPTDIPHGSASPFLTAAHVWLGHRAGELDVTRFGVEQGLGLDGAWFVYGYVIEEVAHRFGDELLLWDSWGAMRSDLAEAPAGDIKLVDEIAELLVAADEGDLSAERDLLHHYREDDRVHPGSRVLSFSPNGGVDEVDLAARTTQKLPDGGETKPRPLGSGTELS